jgi:hypothetical protein
VPVCVHVTEGVAVSSAVESLETLLWIVLFSVFCFLSASPHLEIDTDSHIVLSLAHAFTGREWRVHTRQRVLVEPPILTTAQFLAGFLR